ncbi:xanthine dehydrogenase accessory protein XdhC [bacterium]|nr:xanthine dehydrogenase accessory protein XdhC [bacterium]
MASLWKKIEDWEGQGKRAALCTIIHTKGSTPQKSGAKMLVGEDKEIHGSVGGGALEFRVIEDAVSVIRKGRPKVFEHTLLQDHNMCCGGTVEVYIEPIMTKTALYIFGAGHIGRALAEVADKVGFAVTVIDQRLERFEGWAPEGVSTINKKHEEVLDDLELDGNSFVAVITHDHAFDREIVAHCIRRPHAYLGMIGSRRKVEIARKKLEAMDIPAEKLNTIDWPMGLGIGAKSPNEIAISIIAKMIKLRAETTTHDQG